MARSAAISPRDESPTNEDAKDSWIERDKSQKLEKGHLAVSEERTGTERARAPRMGPSHISTIGELVVGGN